jgi:hypothetical protein
MLQRCAGNPEISACQACCWCDAAKNVGFFRRRAGKKAGTVFAYR